jgi:signal transduction histidine kinase
MRRPSVRLRLLAGAAVAIFIALAVAWLGMTLLFQNHLERRAELELHRDALQLVAGLEAGPDGVLAVVQRPSDPRFETPASGLYWQISAADLIFRSRSLWDQALTAPADAARDEWRTRTGAGPFGQEVLLHERIITPNGSDATVLVQLALDYEELRAARAELGRELALSLAVLWLVLSGAAWIQVQLGLKPLAVLPRRLAALHRNARERLGDDFPPEVQPLTRAIDNLADAREADLKRARQRAADLAHGMKTPLAALSAQSRLVREGREDASAIADSLDRAIASAAAAVEAELARARASATRHLVQDRDSSPALVASRLITVLERTEKGMRLDYVQECPEHLRVAIADEDLSEILGPLLENAVRFARRQVVISGRREGTATIVTIEDDGPGIPESEMTAAMARGRRLDESGGGHGLGLAIARELTEAAGGGLSLGKSSLGGLSAQLRWEASSPA